MTTRAVFFDLGGTLLMMRRDRIFQKVLSEQGRRLDLGEIHAAYLAVEPSWLEIYGFKTMSPAETDEAYRKLDSMIYGQLTPGADPEDAERVSHLVRERWPELEKTVPAELYPDVEPLLDSLVSDGLTMALVSNAPPGIVKTFEDLRLGRYIKHVVVSGVVGFSKPNPEIFKIALRMASVSAQEAIHVGDIFESDVVGARNAGIRGILLDRDASTTKHDCPTISSLNEVRDFLR